MSLPSDKGNIVIMVLDVNHLRPQSPRLLQFWGKFDERELLIYPVLFTSHGLCMVQNAPCFQGYI